MKASPEALIRQAKEAGQHADLPRAQSLLDRAKELNPKQRHLWSTYGAVALDYGKPTEAIEDFNKELANYPDSYDVPTRRSPVRRGCNRTTTVEAEFATCGRRLIANQSEAGTAIGVT